jgi:hypothetical protein
MPYGAPEERRSTPRSEPERRVMETDALLQQSVERLSRNCPPNLVGKATREELLNLTPHVLEALDALADIEGQRSLTEEEYARRRAFRLLLAVA